MIKDKKIVLDECIKVLEQNFKDGFTVPSKYLYPHQWLWDSCFTAIGLRHFDLDQAKQELTMLKRGAWSNGMLPNIIFKGSPKDRDHLFWQSKKYDHSPKNIHTSTITQPPMLAEAVVMVGEKMSKEERASWYESMFSTIVKYHEWLYRERNPDGDGLIVLLHPYESGLDNSPPWVSVLRKTKYPWWVKALNIHIIKVLISRFRRDLGSVPISQRMSFKDAVECLYVVRKLSKVDYKFVPDKSRVPLAVQDLSFNCILIRANRQLAEMSTYIKKPLPKNLLESMQATEDSLEKLWDPKHGQYYSRNYYSKKLIKIPTVAALMPLYAGCISQQRAHELARLARDKLSFKTNFPLPSVPINSAHFRKNKYWQGPTWINANWLVTQGLYRYKFDDLGRQISDSSISLVRANGAYEYFSPLNGSPKGAPNFSWTASLTIDLLLNKKP